MSPIGCIADDLMGAVGCAAAMHRSGERVTVAVGIPPADMPENGVMVIALNSQTATAREARAQGLAAWNWLRARGCRHVFLNVGAAFETLADGHVGTIADALTEALGCGFAPVVPASPETRRTLYMGHLFAGGTLVRDAAGDANLVRVLSRQTDGAVGLAPYATVMQGADTIRRTLLGLKEQGRRYAFVDAVSDADLSAIAEAVSGQPLVIGAAPLAGALAALRSGAARQPAAAALPEPEGYAAVLAGSCARATLFQIGQARGQLATLELDVAAIPDAGALIRQAMEWADGRLGRAPVVIATSTTPDGVAAARAALGRSDADALTAEVMAEVAAGLVERGVRRLMVAGSATSETIVRRLGVRRLRVLMEIDPGAVWNHAEGIGPPLLLALKPGSAGRRGIFAGAFTMLGEPPAQ